MERQQLLPGDDEPGSNPGVLPDISSFRVCTDIFRKWVQIDEKHHPYFWRKENYLDKI